MIDRLVLELNDNTVLISFVSGDVVELVKFGKRVGDDRDSLAEVLLLDDQRGCETDTAKSEATQKSSKRLTC